MIRVVMYIEEDVYRSLKSSLAARGKTVSGWFRDVARAYVRPRWTRGSTKRRV